MEAFWVDGGIDLPWQGTPNPQRISASEQKARTEILV
jgi:hypothetical protein